MSDQIMKLGAVQNKDYEIDRLKNICRILFNRCRVVGCADGAFCPICVLRKECKEMSTMKGGCD